MPEQGVEKRKQTVERIAGRSTVATVKGKLRPEWRTKVSRKYIKMERGGATLNAANDIEIVGGAFEFTQKVA